MDEERREKIPRGKIEEVSRVQVSGQTPIPDPIAGQ